MRKERLRVGVKGRSLYVCNGKMGKMEAEAYAGRPTVKIKIRAREESSLAGGCTNTSCGCRRQVNEGGVGLTKADSGRPTGFTNATCGFLLEKAQSLRVAGGAGEGDGQSAVASSNFSQPSEAFSARADEL